MGSFYKKFKDVYRDPASLYLNNHTGYFNRSNPKNCDAPVFGAQFSSPSDFYERTSGIITGPLWMLFQIVVPLINITMRTIDFYLELFSGNLDEAKNQFDKAGKELLDLIICSIAGPILAVVELFVNLADVGFGIKNTAQEFCTTHFARM